MLWSELSYCNKKQIWLFWANTLSQCREEFCCICLASEESGEDGMEIKIVCTFFYKGSYFAGNFLLLWHEE